MTKHLSADFNRRNLGRARLLPSQKRQRLVNSEWRLANGERRVASSEQFFWRAVLPHCRKFSAHQEMRPPVLPTFGGSGSCPTEKFRHGRSRALQIFAEQIRSSGKFVKIPCPLSRAPCPSLAKASGMKSFRALSLQALNKNTCTHALIHA
jgi:hypothetical protein